MKINQTILAIVTGIIFFGSIGIAKTTGAWETSTVRNSASYAHEGNGQRQGQGSGSESFIRGRTTFKEVIDEGVKKEDIEAAIQKSIPSVSKVIRDFCDENNLRFPEIRAAIEELLKAK